MAKRFGCGLALSVALVALALVPSGCGGGGGGSGSGGASGGGGKAGHGGGGGLNLAGTSGGGFSGAGDVSGGGTAGAATASGGAGGQAGVGGHAGAAGGAGGHGATDGGQDAAVDAGTDAHHEDASTDAQPDGGPDAGPVTCTSACVLGSHRCASGGSQTCVTASNGCTIWGTPAPCPGVTTCATGTGVCACPAAPAGCTAAGTFCNNAGDVVTCTRDAQGCFSASAPQACPSPDQSCKGTLPNAACACDNDPKCQGSNGYCLDASTVATCGQDGNQPSCNVVLSTHGCGGSSFCFDGACVCPAAGTAAGTGCSTLNAMTCSGADILTCVTESSSGCSVWQASTHCGTDGLTCGMKAGAGPACQCAENTGTDLFVDPAAGSDMGTGLFPTGVQNPPACRYATLTKALSVVGSPGQVVAISATVPVAFAHETFPLAVPAGVNLTTADASPTPADYQIAYGGGAASAVTLGSGSSLRGFEIQATGAATALVSCSGGTVGLHSVLLSGGGIAGDGVDVTNSCSLTADSTTIVDFAGAALNMSSTGQAGITGGLLSASLIGLLQSDGTVNAQGLAVQNNGQYGIRLSGAGTPTLTVGGQSVVDNNGTTGNFAGLSVTTGNVSLSNTQLAANGGAGLELASAGTYALDTVQVSNNGKSGVSLLAGVLTAGGLSATNNAADGLTVGGGSAALTGATLSFNHASGLDVLAAVPVDVSGGSLNTNTAAGIAAAAGTLTVHGGAEIAGNATGVLLAGATGSIAGANIHDNTGSGIVVNETSGVTLALGSASAPTTVAANKQHGILLQSAPPIGGSGANSVTVDTVKVTGNGGFGIYLQGTGSVAATIKGSTITGNADTGLMVEQGPGNATSEAIQSNEISGNNTQASPRNVGGILFNTSSSLTSFIGNTVHGNGGDEVGFNALPAGGGTKWTITPPSNACDATANSIYCYGSGNVGVHVLIPAVSVDAQHQHWANNPATSGIDYTGSVTVTNPCSAIATCP